MRIENITASLCMESD